MADESSSTDQQITFTVKSSSDAKHVVTVSTASTVGDLKQKLAAEDYANIPVERQRLIYSGRVLKDPDTLSACKVKEGNTVHLVKGAESNQRQNPANQGGSAVPGAGGSPANNVPQNIQAGTGAGDPLSQLTGARYAGFHGLPGADMFGADGGMGAPPNPDQMLRMLDDPNFAQQMNEAMNNPAVINMLRNNPMIRDNPMARAAIENPELRRMMMNPDMIRMQMQMQRQMGGAGGESGGESFPMPGSTDTTPAGQNTGSAEGGQTGQTGAPPNPFGGAGGANPFAALFPDAGAGAGAGAGVGAGLGAGAGAPGQNAGSEQQANPFASIFGTGAQGGQGGQDQSNPFASAAQRMMQNPQMMQQMMQMMGSQGGAGAGGAGEAGFNPFAGMGGGMAGFGGQEQQQQAPVDNTPPEERYESQLRQLNDMGCHDFERNVQALRRSGGSVQGAIEYLFSG